MSEAYYPMFPSLTMPLRLGNVTLKNRMCSAPMGFPDLTEDGLMTDGAIAFYENRAKGGCALVTISEACVDYKNGKSHGRLINLQNPGILPWLTNAARAIKKHGAVASIQLNHAGMCSEFDVIDSEKKDNDIHYGPSDFGDKVRAMSIEQIDYAVDCYRKGAALVKKAGFQMIMLHMGHGWLVHQFLSPAINHRNDEYGGSIENRARLALRIIDAVREAVGAGFPIDIRFSAMETAAGGIGIKETIEFAKLIDGKVELLHVSAGGEPDFLITHPSMFAPSGMNVHFAEEIKKHVSTPVATVGALNEPEQMEEIIRSGKADAVCMARALLADPELPRKVSENRPEEIIRCLRCFVCHAERMLTQTRICALNPQIGREYEAKFDAPATKIKKVLVIGGGPGGMQAALTAARRGHKVTLCEKEGSLGGNLRCEKNVSFKKAFPKYTEVMETLLRREGVDLRLSTEVSPAYVKSFAPDVLFVAVGAKSLIPDIPGIEKAIPGTEIGEREKEIKNTVAVIGGGLVGCECGVHLALSGRKVSIIEMTDKVAADANPRHRPALMNMLSSHTEVLTGLKAIAVKDDGVLCRDNDGNTVFVRADSVLCAAGLVPNRDLTDSFFNTAPRVEVIGDCISPGIIREATFRGYHAALDI
ncbi:MAG: FAD-dependent oxidoreductase [Oscillospiraceae bacterium]|nr:FAD-dependent oxidoreductase [Oscillospiraceae bacterium]